MVLSAFLTKLFQTGLRSTLSVVLLCGAVPLTANEPFLQKPPAEWTESEALQVLNDSPWAHPIQSTEQVTPCDWAHPAFPALSSSEKAQLSDTLPPQSAGPVTADKAEYVLRINSIKPMQAAAERLIQLDDEKYSRYKTGIGLDPGGKPTNIHEHWYNLTDELAVSLVLKKPGPNGESFREYAFRPNDDGTVAMNVRHIFACSGIRTANGQIHGVVGSMLATEATITGMTGFWVSFPLVVDGKPLITHNDEKVEVRLIVNQHVFETTFTVSPRDLLDGTETVERIPPTVDE